ncbi:MAG: tRNA/rRNA methyltransferase [Bacteroidales bacterium]|nr:tRNA/rRNA methyltransferase [Bacteroidales bacterium]MDD4672557.1 tRNA/rRNA methyltransferase [Bacteroidales bacterium]MDY0348135.1 tRNA/rRNA methyltransferase [Tenuifilaceae bacterium]
MQFTFVLVKPGVPENVGAAARAIKTMGFKDFRLVNPCNYKCVKAQMLAHGSHDILDGAKVFNSLSEALADIDFSVATSAKQRWVKKDVVLSHELKSFLAKKKNTVKSVAIVFGGEESGLSNSDMILCDAVAAIPLPQPYPSLNLAQAVMVFAYSLMDFEVAKPEKPAAAKENNGYKPLKSRVVEILNTIGITSSSLIHGRVLERLSQITDDDVNLLHSVSAAVIERLEEK